MCGRFTLLDTARAPQLTSRRQSWQCLQGDTAGEAAGCQQLPTRRIGAAGTAGSTGYCHERQSTAAGGTAVAHATARWCLVEQQRHRYAQSMALLLTVGEVDAALGQVLPQLGHVPVALQTECRTSTDGGYTSRVVMLRSMCAGARKHAQQPARRRASPTSGTKSGWRALLHQQGCCPAASQGGAAALTPITASWSSAGECEEAVQMKVRIWPLQRAASPGRGGSSLGHPPARMCRRWRCLQHRQGNAAALTSTATTIVLQALPVSSRIMLGCLPFLPSGRRGPAAAAAATMPASRAASSTAAELARIAGDKSGVLNNCRNQAMPLA